MDFFDKAKAVHGNKYKYFNDYKNKDTKINVECPNHGMFKVMAIQHLKGSACKKCLFDGKYNFRVSELRKVHKDKDYEYVKESFKNLHYIEVICKIHGKFTIDYYNHKNGSYCTKCSKTNSSEDFFAKANKIHNNKYKYFNDYKNEKNKINVECSIHGVFSIEPRAHLNGTACKKCLFDENYNFRLNEMRKVHKDYEYDKESFCDIHHIKATCKVHGEFIVDYFKHIKGRGCYRCKKIVHTKESYFKKAKEIHNNKYSYNEDSFRIMTSEIEIFCKDHGWFKQPADTHLHAKCHKCHGNHKHTTEEFIIKANKTHNNTYDYSKVIYLGCSKEVIIICPKKHEFKQVASAHIAGAGCSKCFKSISKKETVWLDSLNINQEFRNIKIKVNGLSNGKNVDGFDPDTNTAYEFLGDYWHGNPNKFKPNDINKRVKKSFKELYDNTMNKIDLMKKHGYNVVYIWEQDFDKM